MADIILWNENKTAFVSARKIREVAVYHKIKYPPGEETCSVVKGWYNNNEHFHFGCFKTPAEANEYMQELQKRMEGK